MNSKNRPNILWIMTDEQRTDSLSCYGSRWGRSPNIDKIASSGVRFTHCTTQSPSCGTANAAIFTGRYVHACMGPGGRGHGIHPQEIPLTWLFKEAGYQVTSLGHCDYPERNRFPFEIYDDGPSYGASAATSNSLIKPYNPRDYDVVALPNHDVAPEPLAGLIVGGRHPLPKEEAEPGLLAKRCEEFLANEVEPPFLLRVSTIAPHTPVLAAEPFYGTTDPAAIDLSIGTEAEAKTKPQFESHNLWRLWCFNKLSMGELRQARANYYDLCLQVDDAIGMILDSLRRHGHDKDTIIAFNSDHGTLLGEHGIGQKRNFYDPVIQVGLIISWPDHLPEGEVVTDPVELLDFLPTMLNLSGLEVPANVHGRNLVAQMLGQSRVPNRPTFSELDSSGVEAYGPCTSHRAMVRDRRWKMSYSLYDAGYGEDGSLYDLEEDPKELHNLYSQTDCKPVIHDLKEKIAAWQKME